MKKITAFLALFLTVVMLAGCMVSLPEDVLPNRFSNGYNAMKKTYRCTRKFWQRIIGLIFLILACNPWIIDPAGFVFLVP